MKLIPIYSIFDGLELLEGSVQQIYTDCDKFIFHYQTTSNTGEVDFNVEKYLIKMCRKYSKINLLIYEPSLDLNGSQNEKRKRQLGINYARNIGATHYLLMDCDEYYPKEQFNLAKQTLIINNYDSSACRLYTYYKQPNYRLTPIENYFVPFIHSINCNLTKHYHVYADPTRGAMGNKFYAFKENELIMHHFSWVRMDIEKKLRNSSANVNWRDKIPEMVEQFHTFDLGDEMIPYPGHSLRRVDNPFDLYI